MPRSRKAPAIRRCAANLKDGTLDKPVEHDGAKVLINDLESATPDADFYDAKVTVLSEEIKHHVKEEEAPSEGMFAQARETDVELVELRDQMMARKQELMAQAEGAGLPIAKPSAVNLVTA